MRAGRARRFARACGIALLALSVVASADEAQTSSEDREQRAESNGQHGFALGGDVESGVLELPRSVESVKFVDIELSLMSSSHVHLLGILPSETSTYCEQSGVKANWRRFVRAIDGLQSLGDDVKCAEVTHEGRDVSKIAEVKAYAGDPNGRRRAKAVSCGFIAVTTNNMMSIYDGDLSAGNALAQWLDAKLAKLIGDEFEEIQSRHEAVEFVERNETAVRMILLEQTNWLTMLSRTFQGRVAFARASSLVGFNYLRSVMFDQPGISGLLFIPKLDQLENEDRSQRVEVKLVTRRNETFDFYDATDTMQNAMKQLGYDNLVESTIDVDCANAIWSFVSNSIHPEFNEATQGVEGATISPTQAWRTLKSDLLMLLDGHGKGDKTLGPQQWLCGLAGLTAAHREIANEYVEATSALDELETLRKENYGLRQRNAALERELAQCDSSAPKSVSGAKRLPKAKPADWGFDSTEFTLDPRDDDASAEDGLRAHDEL